ncbi:WecB/TagA/CpsF family glycosyltransferase [Geodermatophilus ruber]|uniref:N-acetylglucosaminyldiphosphoundecaprenol N-acetyl-beta-D-mannosaminyltransferase n=1 Tax=Geodermatophilus ruber TaxID=504800 RepID=A0A1I4DH13_9ACTN|nr:N-acetylglucosaminyldiphosphoundecaprenol N-acetyl-beta-D-mannosaminyltransferase [Geodermatophilus ruber]
MPPRATTDNRASAPLRNPSIGQFDGVPIRLLALEPAATEVLSLCRQDNPGSVRLVNAYSLALASKDAKYRGVLSGRGMSLADGRPLASYLRRKYQLDRLPHSPGPSLFEETIRCGAPLGIRHYLLGSTDDVLHKLTSNLQRRYPEATIVAAESPPFHPLETAEKAALAKRITDLRADIVWVALGTPKQDFFSTWLAERTGTLCVAVGAAFSFSAGTIPTAPPLLRRLHLEWAFRLASEPRRLWRRYAIGNARFLVRLFRDAWVDPVR